MKEKIVCICCGESEYSAVFRKVGLNNRFDLLRCIGCGLVGAFDSKDLHSKEVDYEGEPCDYLIPTDNDIEHRMRLTRRRHKRYTKAIAKHLGTGKKILDFGAGAGYFVKYCEESGHSATGVELSENLVDFARSRLGVQLVPDLPATSELYDAISMFDVIEHFDWNSSRHIIAKLIDRMAPGGLFLGNTPNFHSLNIRISGPRDPVISPPYHTTYFTPETLNLYLISFGLQKVEIATMIFSEERFFRKFSLYDTGNENKITGLNKRLIRFAFKVLFRPLFWLLPLFGAGYQIYYCYRKPGN